MAEVKKETSKAAVNKTASKPATAPKATTAKATAAKAAAPKATAAKTATPAAKPAAKPAVKPNKKADKQIKVTLIKSTNKCVSSIKKTVEALGLHRIGETKIHNDNPAIRGAIFKVKHMVVVEEVNGKEAK